MRILLSIDAERSAKVQVVCCVSCIDGSALDTRIGKQKRPGRPNIRSTANGKICIERP